MDTTAIRKWYPLPVAGDTDPATCAAAMIHRLCDEIDRQNKQWGAGPVKDVIRIFPLSPSEPVKFTPRYSKYPLAVGPVVDGGICIRWREGSSYSDPAHGIVHREETYDEVIAPDDPRFGLVLKMLTNHGPGVPAGLVTNTVTA